MRGSLSSSEKDTLITELQAKVTQSSPFTCTLGHVSRITQVSSLYAELRAAEEATAATVTYMFCILLPDCFTIVSCRTVR
jgi:hypothetical protein